MSDVAVHISTPCQCALGLSRQHLSEHPVIGLSDPDAAAALERLIRRASTAGIDLAVASGFRDYARQLSIFNAKAAGTRVVQDARGAPLNRSAYSDPEWLHAILRFSALPGTSRHHWGTDFDVWDRAAVDQHYQLGLTPAEYASDGPFALLNAWLTEHIDADDAEGFFRPYAEDRGGVAPEPWHISYRPSAERMRARLDPEILGQIWRGVPVHGMDCLDKLALLTEIESELPELLERYVVR